jgi:hypothetical protein
MQKITRIVQESVLDGPLPAKVIAKEIGKPYSTMLREINPYDTYGKLGVETCLHIMQVTGNIEPLRYMAEQLGYELVPAMVHSVDTSSNSYERLAS